MGSLGKVQLHIRKHGGKKMMGILSLTLVRLQVQPGACWPQQQLCHTNAVGLAEV